MSGPWSGSLAREKATKKAARPPCSAEGRVLYCMVMGAMLGVVATGLIALTAGLTGGPLDFIVFNLGPVIVGAFACGGTLRGLWDVR